MKNIRRLLLIFALFLGTLAFGQGWQRNFHTFEQAGQVQQTPDGGAVFSAVKSSPSNGRDLVIVKTDLAGKVQWQKTLGGSGNDQNRFLFLTQSGDIIVCGLYAEVGQSDKGLVARLSIFGEVIWQHNWSFQSMRSVVAGAEMNDGSILFLAETGGDALLVKTQNNGDTLQSYPILETAGWQVRQIQIAENQEIIVTLVSGNGSISPPTVRLMCLSASAELVKNLLLPHLTNYLALPTAAQKPWSDSTRIMVHRDSLYRLDDTLGVLNRERLETPLSLYLTDVLPFPNGNFQVLGTHYQFDSPAQNDIYLSRFNALGLPLWERYLPAPNTIHATQKTALAPDNGVYLTGNYPQNAYLMRLDSTGNVFTNSIHGKVFWDKNENCLSDLSDIPLQNWLIEITHPNGAIFYASTDSAGYFETAANIGTYQIRPILPNITWGNDCSPTATLTFLGYFQADSVDFSIKKGLNCPFPQVSIGLEKWQNCDNLTPVHLLVQNQGSSDLLDSKVQIQLDSLLDLESASLPFAATGHQIWEFSMGDIAALSEVEFWIFVQTNCAVVLGSTLCLEAKILQDLSCFGALTVPFLQVNGICTGDSVRFEVKNIGRPMTQSLDFIVIEDNIMYLQGQMPLLDEEETTVFTFPANGKTWRLESRQDPNLPRWVGESWVADAVESCTNNSTSNVGFINQFSHFDGGILVEKECREIALNEPATFTKIAYPEGWGIQHFISQNTDIEYFIKFKNTSGDTVRQVTLRDTLDFLKLDIGSLQLVMASHSYTYSVSGEGVLTVVFPQIYLPDSSQNVAASQGWIQFRISQKTNLPIGTIIVNRAALGFDFMAYSGSNVVWHVVNATLGEQSPPELPKPEETFVLFPNPADDEIIISSKTTDNWQFSLTDVTGRQVYSGNFSGRKHRFSPQTLANGMYFLHLQSDTEAVKTARIFIVH
jgi:hypothetical protein